MSDITDRSSKLDTLTNAVLHLLRTESGRPIGDHDIPESISNPPKATDYPYGILYSVDGGGFEGPMLERPDEFTDRVFNVTCVGLTREQCQFFAEVVRDVMSGRDDDGRLSYALEGAEDREPIDPPGGVRRDGIAPNFLWSHAQEYVVKTLN